MALNARWRAAARFTFPGARRRVVFEAGRPHSQWRNRAGLAPDFPVMPDMGDRRETRLYHRCISLATWTHNPQVA